MTEIEKLEAECEVIREKIERVLAEVLEPLKREKKAAMNRLSAAMEARDAVRPRKPGDVTVHVA